MLPPSPLRLRCRTIFAPLLERSNSESFEGDFQCRCDSCAIESHHPQTRNASPQAPNQNNSERWRGISRKDRRGDPPHPSTSKCLSKRESSYPTALRFISLNRLK